MGFPGLSEILELPVFKGSQKNWKQVSPKISVLLQDGMVAMNKLMGYKTDIERAHHEECKKTKGKVRELCVVPKSSTRGLFLSASFLYSQWKERMWDFLRTHQPKATEHKQTFGVISHDKPHHQVPFALKDECRAQRAKGRDLVPKIPESWRLHANGYYTDEMLKTHKVSSPDQLSFTVFYSIPIESMLRTPGRLREFTDFLHKAIQRDSTLPSYARLLLDWKAGETVIVNPQGGPLSLPDNAMCESDVSVPYWIRYLAKAYPQDTCLRGGFCVETTDGDTLAIQLLHFGLNPRIDVYWRKLDKDDTCYRVRDIVEAAKKQGWQRGQPDAVLIQALVLGLIATGCDHWTKSWMIFSVGNPMVFTTIVTSNGLLPIVPVEMPLLTEIVSSGGDEEKMSELAKLAMRDGIVRLKKLHLKFKELAGAKYKEDKVSFTPKARFLKLCAIFYYWSDPLGAQEKSMGFVSSKHAGEKHKARKSAKRKATAEAEDDDEKAIEVKDDADAPPPKRQATAKYSQLTLKPQSSKSPTVGHPQSSKPPVVDLTQPSKSPVVGHAQSSKSPAVGHAQSASAPSRMKPAPVSLKLGQKRPLSSEGQIAPVKSVLTVPILTLK